MKCKRNKIDKQGFIEYLLPFFLLFSQYKIGVIPISTLLLTIIAIISCIKNRFTFEKYNYSIFIFFLYVILHDIINVSIGYSDATTSFNRLLEYSVNIVLMLIVCSNNFDEEKLYIVWRFAFVLYMIGMIYHLFVIYIMKEPVQIIQILPGLENINLNESNRPRSFFQEPSYISEAILPFVFLALKKNDYKWAILSSIIIVLSTSSNGIILMIILWVLDLFSLNQKSYKFKLLSIVFITMILLGPNEMFKYSLNKLSDVINGGSTYLVRVTQGFEVVGSLGFINKLFGTLYNEPVDYIWKNLNLFSSSLKEMYFLYGKNIIFMNGIASLIFRYGILGLYLFFSTLKGTLKKSFPARNFVIINIIALLGNDNILNAPYFTVMIIILLYKNNFKEEVKHEEEYMVNKEFKYNRRIEMKRYLWVGSFTTDQIHKKLQRLGYKNSAQYLAQKNIHEGLEKVLNIRFDSIGAVILPDEKNGTLINSPRIDFSHNDSSFDCIVGYFNLKYLNRLFSSLSMNWEIKKWIRSNVNKGDVIEVYMYEMRSACLNAAKVIKKNCNARVHLIVPDLPMFMSGKYSLLKMVLKKIDSFFMTKKFVYVDDFILFAQPMAEYLGIQNLRWMLMEGSININDLSENHMIESNVDDKFLLMYSGIIDESYGIMSLIQAFKELGDNYELWITGGGISENVVKASVRGLNNIKYFGYLESRDEVLELQKKSKALINLRNPYEESSKYCFPSKVFEYMLSGVPVISSKIEGIPEEYYKYFINLSDTTVQEIVRVIKYVDELGSEQRDNIAKKAREFIIKDKNNIVQSKRIVSFVTKGENNG